MQVTPQAEAYVFNRFLLPQVLHSKAFVDQAFKRRLEIVAKSNGELIADMQVYIRGITSAGLGISVSTVHIMSPQFGGSDTSRGSVFNDANDIGNIDPQRPIERITVHSGWVVDGLE